VCVWGARRGCGSIADASARALLLCAAVARVRMRASTDSSAGVGHKALLHVLGRDAMIGGTTKTGHQTHTCQITRLTMLICHVAAATKPGDNANARHPHLHNQPNSVF
jgi:hypothetical protein